MNKIISEIFRNKTVNISKLPEFGFTEADGKYLFRTEILEGSMQLTVSIDKNGRIDTEVFDCEMQEPYTLFLVEEAVGGFVGEVREEYRRVLRDISEKCCRTEVFKSEQAKLLIEYVRNKYGDELEFLWEKFSDNAVWRRKDNNKWYGLICTVKKRTLGFLSDDRMEIAVLRMSPAKLESIVDNKKYFRGYHMNKKNWVTLPLDGTLSFDEIRKCLDDSYALAVK